MSQRIQPVKGTHDILPEEQGPWQRLRRVVEENLPLYGYREIATPMFEATELFERSVGVATDIVEKEMYTFADSKGRRISLRPEGTAGVVRSVVGHGRLREYPLDKLYYFGPMFRRERPQKGRFRQFHQFGVEAIGEASATLDVEVIALLMHLLEAAGVTDVTLQLNSVGCPDCRPGYREVLVGALRERADRLCGDCERRIDTNPLRVFDCKVPTCGEALAGAPLLLDHLCAACAKHLERVEAGLAALVVAYQINPRLVRGLDYYTRTAFEAVSGSLGAQAAVAAGGRYDGLVEELGGPPTPAIGFAIGLERLIELMPTQDVAPSIAVYVATLGTAAQERGLQLADSLRHAGLSCELDHGSRSLKAQLKRADRLGARKVVILGDTELATGEAVVRDLGESQQQTVSLEDLVNTLASVA
ncbi:MAG: histidine--tRNA ligase [Nitrospirota bacterium]|jgi:histidyl-tRNA synthetase